MEDSMELRVVESSGVPADSLVSICIGGTRKHGSLGPEAVYRFGRDAGQRVGRVDVFVPIARARLLVELKSALFSIPLGLLEGCASCAAIASSFPDSIDVVLDYDGEEGGCLEEDALQHCAGRPDPDAQSRLVVECLLQAVLKDKPLEPCEYMLRLLENSQRASDGSLEAPDAGPSPRERCGALRVRIADVRGFPEGSLVVIRVGATKRQSSLSSEKTYRFGGLRGTQQMKIDFYVPFACADFVIEPQAPRCAVPLSRAGDAALEFAVCAATATDGAKGAAAEAKGREQQAYEFLRRHRLQGFFQELLATLVQERPAELYAYITRWLEYKREDLLAPCPLVRRTSTQALLSDVEDLWHAVQELDSAFPMLRGDEVNDGQEMPADNPEFRRLPSGATADAPVVADCSAANSGAAAAALDLSAPGLNRSLMAAVKDKQHLYNGIMSARRNQ
eukprot:TRINITY_DN12281_c0_g1_i2.p1 TRINITY_DN12281_c0_g1~~TRINITY_DN12281_c0_g1_i2.p1  ORF type:complete len:449 (-),score=103.52 TRINITY_DN12281_c0_g1_i2:33-1379(-)